jgi:hypothetical protein
MTRPRIYSSAAAFHTDYPRYRIAAADRDLFRWGAGWPLGSDEHRVRDRAGRAWMVRLLGPRVVSRATEPYRTRRGERLGGVAAHTAPTEEHGGLLLLLVDGIDLHDALEAIYARPRPSLERLTAELGRYQRHW